jgi:hypothetical protein
MPGNPRLVRHRGTGGLSSTVSLDSFNSTNNIKNNTINNNNNDNNSTKNINDTNDNNDGGSITNSTDKNIIGTPTRRLRTQATTNKQTHKLNTTVYRIFCDDGALHQGYICGFDTKEGYYKI